MNEFQPSPLMPKPTEQAFAAMLADDADGKYSPEISLMTTNCGVASHVLAEYSAQRHGIQLEPYIGRIDGMTFTDSYRPFWHLLLRDRERSTIIDPTALQVLGRAGLTWFDEAKFPSRPSFYADDDRMFEIKDTPEGINAFADFASDKIQRTRTDALAIRDQLSLPRDGSQAFLDMDSSEIHDCLVDMWTMEHYAPDPLSERKPHFQEKVASIAEKLISLE